MEFKKFNEFYKKILSNFDFDFNSIKKYGIENKILVLRKPKPRKAIQATSDGYIVTRETKENEKTPYKRGDWIITDDQGGKYPCSDFDFKKFYDVDNPLKNNMYMSFPREETVFRTDKKIEINSKWGTYIADKNDFISISEAGTLGCPIKTDAMNSGYSFIKYS